MMAQCACWTLQPPPLSCCSLMRRPSFLPWTVWRVLPQGKYHHLHLPYSCDGVNTPCAQRCAWPALWCLVTTSQNRLDGVMPPCGVIYTNRTCKREGWGSLRPLRKCCTERPVHDVCLHYAWRMHGATAADLCSGRVKNSFSDTGVPTCCVATAQYCFPEPTELADVHSGQ